MLSMSLKFIVSKSYSLSETYYNMCMTQTATYKKQLEV